MSDKDNEELRKVLDKMIAEHVSIPWLDLPDDSPIYKFAQSYNFYHDKCGEGEGWAEAVLTALTNAKGLDDLAIYESKFSESDWFVCSQLLKSGFSVSPKLIGALLEKILMELHEIKIAVPVLGIKKPSRGRPFDERARRSYLGFVLHEVNRLKNKEGMSANQAYDHIGKHLNKSADTIRRDYERHVKERELRKNAWVLERKQTEKGDGEK